jgi:putative transposase
MIVADEELSVSEQRQLSGVERSSYDQHGGSENSRNLLLMRRIDELYTVTPTWGSRKIRDRLRLEGHAVYRKRIRRLLRIMVLQVICPKRHLLRSLVGAKVYPYLLRDMAIVWQNHVWWADITYIRLAHGFVYLAAILDWASRKVLSWELPITADQYFVIHAVEEARRRYGAPRIFNTDQGSQFTCPGFVEPLLGAGVRMSTDGKGRALDNLAIKRFHRSLKYDEVYLKDYADLPEARREIGAYIERYNSFRPHQALGGRKPDAAYAEGRRESAA